jgi:phenylacetate-CoA oxygenase, PaaH subunit
MKNFILKYYYGDIPEDKSGGAADARQTATQSDWPLWEVFIRSKQGLDHKHVGSLHAADAQMAIENARDVYTRRMEGVSIWVVESKYIHASNPEEAESFYEPASDKVYRHPTFYNVPDEVKHM